MASCCCSNPRTDKMAVSCLGRCDLPKHRCLEREDIGPGPIPKCMGWLYTAKDSPEHQLRCGWRPGHISCPVLRRIEEHNCGRCGTCSSCCGGPSGPCLKPPCGVSPCSKLSFLKPCPRPPCGKCGPSPRCCSRTKCVSSCSPCSSCGGPCIPPSCTKPMIRIVRHNGQYSIITKPDNVTNHPSGPYPLKYVLNTDDHSSEDAKFSIEAKFNDYHFDYTSSQSSFVLDFSPPENKCTTPCPKRSSVCFPCQEQPKQGSQDSQGAQRAQGAQGTPKVPIEQNQGRKSK